MVITFHPYFLTFKKPFALAHGTRTDTDLVFVKLEHLGFIGFGEASLPPYRKETKESVVDWIKKNSEFNLNKNIFFDNLHLDIPFSNENPAASAALEMAVLDWYSQAVKIKLNSIIPVSTNSPKLTLTVTKNDFDVLDEKLQIAKNFHYLKLKLTGKDDDIDFIKAIRKKTDLPFCIDFNQGHSNKEKAIIEIEKLEKENCILIEQPLKDNDHEGHLWLKLRTPLPIIADESIQNLYDLNDFGVAYSGVNIKLMKCGGLTNAFRMIKQAEELKLMKLIGCMSESSLGVATASILAPFCDMADLDAPYLNNNDPFNGFQIREGKIEVEGEFGIGVSKNKILKFN